MKTISAGTIVKMLRKININFKRSKNVLKERNFDRIMDAREKISKNLCFLMKHNFFFIYIDETAIDEKLF